MRAPHTPGPWRVDPEYVCDVQTADGRTEIACVQEDGSTLEGEAPIRDVAVANALLIAAAPELLAQLQFAVKLLGAFPAINATAQIEAMRAAIARAAGAL